MHEVFSIGVMAAWLCVAGSAAGGAPAAAAAQGWRGDGTGRYPGADPPTTWGRVSRAVQGLRFQAAEPGAGHEGRPMPDGVIREWLVLGPVAADEVGAKEEAVAGEAGWSPAAGRQASGRTWRKVTLETAYLDFVRLLARQDRAEGGGAAASEPAGSAEGRQVFAYACAWVRSDADRSFRVNLTSVGGVRVYINGKPAAQAFVGRSKLDLVKGWNRILLRVAPGRNDQTPNETDWYAVPVFHAWQAGEGEETNIAWRTALPGAWPGFYGGGMGLSPPVIVGDRLYMLCEPYDLVCLRKTDGAVLWVRRVSYFEAADEADRKQPACADARAIVARLDAVAEALVAGRADDKLFAEKIELEKDLLKAMKAVDGVKYKREHTPDVGFSGFTTVTDGRCVWTWSASGVTACHDLDGRRKWIRLDRRPEVEHGFSSSPLLIDGKLVVFMRDMLAFDAGTGKLLWRNGVVGESGLNPQGFFHGSLVAVDLGGTPAIALANGTILRARDGATLHAIRGGGNQGVSSPVVAGRELLFVTGGSMKMHVHDLPAVLAEPLKLPTREIDVATRGFPKHYLPWHLGSPVVHEALAYLVNNAGVLTVVDLAAGRVLYQRMLDLDVFQAHNEGAARGIGASPALAGKYIYFVGNNGATVVIEPGRTFKQVAKNKIESLILPKHWSVRQERFMANPVFDGRRLYLRGENYLYAIEAP